jgi:hypothetical protein
MRGVRVLSKQFILGERRRVTMEVYLNDKARFVPENCTWELLSGMTAEDSGACETQEQEDGKWWLTCEIQPKARRTYTLQYTFGLGTEIIKRNTEIRVV